MATKDDQPIGYLYRGATREVQTGIYKILLVKDETYVVPYLTRIYKGQIEVMLKKPSASIKINIPLSDYYQYLSSGRTSFKDEDPYQ